MAVSGELLTIIAGGGTVPLHVAAAAADAGRRVFIVGLVGQADPGIAAYKHAWIDWGEMGRLDGMLKEEGGRDVVFIGGIRARPDYRKIKLDRGTLKLLPDILRILAGGDSDLLSGVVRIFEKRGYHILGAHEVAHDLVADPGPFGRRSPGKDERRDAERALNAARAIGAIDAGQAAVALNGRVVALEAAEGTDEMLERVGALHRGGKLKWKGRAGVLAKCAKPQQDLRVDMPAIGPRTIEAAAAIGLAGIAVEAGRVMIVDREETVRRADAAGLFLVGVDGARAAA